MHLFKCLQLVGFFVSLGISPKIRFDGQNGGNALTKIWQRYTIFRKFTPLWASQNLIFWKNTARVLTRVSLADFIRSFRSSVWRKPPACPNPIWAAGTYSVPVCAKIVLMVLKAYTGFSDRQLVEHLNGNIHYQMFCRIMINPSFPITNYKIVSTIRNEIASRLDIDSFQEILPHTGNHILITFMCA